MAVSSARGAEHLCLIRPRGEALALETMFLAEDVNSQAEIEESVAESEVKAPELGLARQVIESLVGEFDPKELTSEYRQNLRQMLESKLTDGQIVAKPEPVAEGDAGRRPHGGAQAERRGGQGRQVRKEDESRLEGRLSKARRGAKKRLTS